MGSARDILVLLGYALGSAACKPAEAEPPRSAVLLTLDTTRGDALGCYGGRPELTPHLDRLATESLLYERAYTVAPLTLPAHASMMTGLYPPRHGIRDNGAFTLPRSAETLAERARAAGFETAAFVSSVVLDQGFGLEQGFEIYAAPRHDSQQVTSHYSDLRASQVVARARRWLEERDPARPFFLWVHIWDPHGPYEPPPPFNRLAPEHPYLGEVAAADAGVGLLVQGLREANVWDSTLFAVVADHGEAFFEHGEFSHGVLCQDTTMRVPFLLRYPDGYRAGERESAIASVADVAPTLSVALGLGLPGNIDGESLFRRSVGPERGAYLESYHGYLAYGWSPLAGWVDGQGKYLHSSMPEFTTPQNDPDEQREQAADRTDLERYRGHLARIGQLEPLPRSSAGPENEALRAKVRSLGYAGFGQGEERLPKPLEPSELPSPKSRIAEHRQGLDALGLFNAGRYAEAEALHRQILAGNPRNYHSLERLAVCLIRQQRFTEAIAPLQQVIDFGRASASSYVNLGICMRKAGNLERAVALFEQALATDPNQVRALGNLIGLHRAAGRAASAAPLLERFEQLTGTPFPDGG